MAQHKRYHLITSFLLQKFMRVAVYGYYLSLSILIFSACSVSDDRDICCNQTSIFIRYVRDNSLTDRYSEFIGTTEYFWFNDKGVLLSYEKPLTSSDIQHPSPPPSFKHGKYTLLVLGNRSSIPLRFEVGKTNLSDLKLQIKRKPQGSMYGNTDRLYWGLLPFQIYSAKEGRYICDMSNIHCWLRVKVKWENNPPSSGGLYSLRLENLPRSYRTDLHPKVPKIVVTPLDQAKKFDSNEYRVVHSFPTIEPKAKAGSITQELLVPMSSGELVGDFISFRYDDDFIPIFRVWKDGTPQIKEIDLTNFFNENSVILSKIYEQVFFIVMKVKPNGVVHVEFEGDLDVKDWEDGGDIDAN